MKVICITGATGQVGKEFQNLESEFSGFKFLFAGKFELDITNPQYVADFFRKNKVDYLINCAAYTAVDKAEDEPELARAINVEGARELAQSCLIRNIPLIHISTDYVYHGDGNHPLLETDATHPQGVYASTKLEGEKVAMAIHPMTTIIRTSWVYSNYGHNFYKTMLRLSTEKSELNIVNDQIGTPTYAKDLATTILTMIQKVESEEVPFIQLRGIFNFSNEGETNWAEFASEIFSLTGAQTKVNPIATSAYPTKATRPAYSLMDKSKIKKTFGIEIRDWKEALKECVEGSNTK
ncbi:MAG: dTDP-4-dehydrorhamnose reductase [Saprospiraceae bacterium]|nr:dTDP-4-dehydrorhamnose reductase [Saprospiraceae bacterium]